MLIDVEDCGDCLSTLTHCIEALTAEKQRLEAMYWRHEIK